MKQRILSFAFALCFCLPTLPTAHAWQDAPPQAYVSTADTPAATVPYAAELVPTPQEVYATLIAYKTKDGYTEGTTWTDETHPNYKWSGNLANGANIGSGCVAFAYELSDAAFGSLPARMCAPVQLSDVKVGDILQVNNNAHSVIVLQMSDVGVTVAEGNLNGKVSWGRSLTKDEVEAADYLLTRYPENYVPPDDPSANQPIGSGTISGSNLTWTLAKSGTLTISGTGDMPDFSSDPPWSQYLDTIQKIVIQDGVTKVGADAFQGCKALSAEISASVTEIGDRSFQNSPNLLSLTIAEGVKTIGQNAFSGCGKLKSIALPASIECVRAAAFMECQELTEAVFAPGSKQVEIGDNLFSRCYRLANVTLPAQIDRISDGMFTNCGALLAVTIPKGATSIGNSAFASCNQLKSVTIPDSVELIDIAAFSACGVTDIYYGGSEDQWNAITKQGDSNSTLQSKTIHYNSIIPDPEPNPNPDPGPDPDPNPDPTPGPGHTHSWDGGTVTKPASCTASGVRTYTCTACGNTQTQSIAALGHNYAAQPVTKPATCTEAGEQTSVCTRCGDVLTKTIPAKGHDFVRNDYGEYECVNERNENGASSLVVSASIGEGYLAVKRKDGHTAPVSYQDADAAQKYLSEVVQAALESVDRSLRYTITTIRYTPPTQTVDGEYIYQVTIQSNGRAAASSLTTEPLRMVIPAGSVPVPNPDPKPTPDRDDSTPDREPTYGVTVLKTTGGKVTANVRNAERGDRVTLTVQPDAGYELTELTVADAWNRKVSVEDLGENRFRFTMPGLRVEIRTVFTASDSTQDSSDSKTPEDADTALNPLPMSFTDVKPSDWYYSSIAYMWQHNLMKGVSETQFAPYRTTSRAMIWTILARMHNVPTDPTADGLWYEKGMLWAMEQGVSDGSSPLQDITREQLAVMLWRNAGRPEGGSLDRFSDAADVSSYAVSAMQWAVERGILQGNSGYLNPKANATRAATAAMITRYASSI